MWSVPELTHGLHPHLVFQIELASCIPSKSWLPLLYQLQRSPSTSALTAQNACMLRALIMSAHANYRIFPCLVDFNCTADSACLAVHDENVSIIVLNHTWPGSWPSQNAGLSHGFRFPQTIHLSKAHYVHFPSFIKTFNPIVTLKSAELVVTWINCLKVIKFYTMNNLLFMTFSFRTIVWFISVVLYLDGGYFKDYLRQWTC